MACITPERIGELIEAAPAWAKLALTHPNERLRTDGLETLSHHIYHSLYRAVEVDASQLALPL